MKRWSLFIVLFLVFAIACGSAEEDSSRIIFITEVPDNSSAITSEDIPGEVLNEAQDKVSDETPNQTMDEESGNNDVPDEASDKTQNKLPDKMPDKTAEDIPVKTKVEPGNIPNNGLDEASEDIPDEEPDDEPDSTPDEKPDEASDKAPDETEKPEGTPEKLPDKQPDDYSHDAETDEHEMAEDEFTLKCGDVEAKLDEDPTGLIGMISRIDGCEPSVSEGSVGLFTLGCTEYSGKEMSVCSKSSEKGESICAVFVDTSDWKTSRGVKVGDSINDVFTKYRDFSYVIKGDCILYSTNKKNQKNRVLIFQIDSDNDTVYSMAILSADDEDEIW